MLVLEAVEGVLNVVGHCEVDSVAVIILVQGKPEVAHAVPVDSTVVVVDDDDD